MSREAAVEALQAQHGHQQGAHAALRGREPLQVSDKSEAQTSYVRIAGQSVSQSVSQSRWSGSICAGNASNDAASPCKILSPERGQDVRELVYLGRGRGEVVINRRILRSRGRHFRSVTHLLAAVSLSSAAAKLLWDAVVSVVLHPEACVPYTIWSKVSVRYRWYRSEYLLFNRALETFCFMNYLVISPTI